MTCVWPADLSCCDWDSYDVQVRASALVAATEILWALSGRVFAGEPMADAFTADEMTELKIAGYTPDCSTILRPCKQHCGTACDMCGWPGPIAGPSWYTPWMPYLRDGTWFNASCGSCGDLCQCGAPLDELELPGPVAKVNAVYIDGAVFTEWALYNSDTLVRTDGEDWPGCQHLDRELTDEGTWAVDYVRGVPVPEGGKRAAGLLACELAKLCTGDKTCRIPANVTSVTRDGVSFTFDPNEFYAQGKTGIPAIDLWLSAVNPGHMREPSGVYTPQTLRRRGWQRRQPGEVRPS